MGKEIFINLEKEVFIGNVLDIGFENYGVVYELCKNIDDDIAVDYVTAKDSKNNIENNFYDSCVIFFSLFSAANRNAKKHIIKEAYDFISSDGTLHLWDINKPRFKTSNIRLKIVVPNKILKTVQIKALNPFTDASYESTMKVLKPYFNIIDLKHSNDIYYIKAQKKLG